MNEGVKASVSLAVRAAVDAVAGIYKETEKAVSIQQLAGRLGIDDSSARRRVRVALEAEYLIDLANEKSDQPGRMRHYGKAIRLMTGEPMPEETSVLPSPDDLRKKYPPPTPPETTARLHDFLPGAPDADEAEPEREVFYV